MSTSFSGPDQVDRYRAIVLATGLDLYRKTGLRPNRAYTPKAMMTAAAEITGRKFKARAYQEAAEALREWAHRQPG